MKIAEKIEDLRKIFNPSLTDEARYLRIIDMGRSLPRYPEELKLSHLQVQGCQSLMYLSSKIINGKIFFQVGSDSLLSNGLAALLLFVYSEQAPEDVLKTPPAFLAELGILSSLTPSRSNGLANIHLRMKRDALLSLKDKSLDFNSPAR